MSQTLDNAPDDIKLAVDLICLLEENKVDPKTVLSALEIVKTDFERKLSLDKGTE
ncbi:pleiotropic regulatory protein RsmS [Vibrio sp. SS-MA-C1-2]|uniref:pleiotropic regulatory protein RsmS n=1 Tax=Vibrio sp. SS-MA-C1-2 TaxID=2908646 RepID=UPI001F3D0015|nr:pleiotropic regulatory protein RsmS [Vibrio sp. SS-MA-C1-2]UJF18679.1 pleiotropic regulatory protein RsmS [Vibrio sp. SS-MA-C1-2]